MRAGIKYSPAHQDDPRAPQTQLRGGLEAQARGAPGDYYSFTNQAGKNEMKISTILGLEMCKYLPRLAVAQRAFHKMFQ